MKREARVASPSHVPPLHSLLASCISPTVPESLPGGRGYTQMLSPGGQPPSGTGQEEDIKWGKEFTPSQFLEAS